MNRYVAEHLGVVKKIDALTLHSAVNGYVSEIYPSRGEYLETGDPILKLISDRVFVRAAIPLSSGVVVGDLLRVTSIDDTPVEIDIDTHARSVSPTPDMLSMLIVETNSLKNDKLYQAGKFCRIKIEHTGK